MKLLNVIKSSCYTRDVAHVNFIYESLKNDHAVPMSCDCDFADTIRINLTCYKGDDNQLYYVLSTAYYFDSGFTNCIGDMFTDRVEAVQALTCLENYILSSCYCIV